MKKSHYFGNLKKGIGFCLALLLLVPAAASVAMAEEPIISWNVEGLYGKYGTWQVYPIDRENQYADNPLLGQFAIKYDMEIFKTYVPGEGGFYAAGDVLLLSSEDTEDIYDIALLAIAEFGIKTFGDGSTELTGPGWFGFALPSVFDDVMIGGETPVGDFLMGGFAYSQGQIQLYSPFKITTSF